MKIINLPVANEPRKILTVKRRSENLKEHHESFESVNNPKGFPEEKERELLPVEAKVLELASKQFRTIDHIKKTARQMVNATKGTDSPVRLTAFYDAVARAFGYEVWNEAMASSTDGQFIRNLKYGAKLEKDFVLEGRPIEHLYCRPDQSPYPYGFKIINRIRKSTINMGTKDVKTLLKEMATELGYEVRLRDATWSVEYVIATDAQDNVLLIAHDMYPSMLPARMIARKMEVLPASKFIIGFGPITEYTGPDVFHRQTYCLLKG